MTPNGHGTGRRPDGAAFTIAILLAGLGLLLLWDASRMPDKGGYSGVGPDGMPRVIGYCLLALAVWTGISGLKGAAPRDPQAVGPVLWIIGGLVLQLLLLKPAGFAIASGLLFAFTAAGFGKRKLLFTIPIGIVFALAVYGVFDRVLKLNLPAGPVEMFIFGG